MRTTLLVLVLMLAAPALAHAQTTGGAKGALAPVGLALGPDGAGLLGVHADTTDYSDGISCRTAPTTSGYVSVRAASGALGPLRPLGADVAAGPERRPDGTFATVLSQTTGVSGECTPLANFELATLDATGAVTARTPLANGADLFGLTLSGGEIAWVEREAADWALKLSHNGLPPVTVASGEGVGDVPYVSDFALVPDGAGRLLVWAEPRRVRAAAVSAEGALGPAVDLGRTDTIADLDAGVAPTGRAVVAWATQDGGEERNRPLRVLATIRPHAGAPFARARTLARGHRVDDPVSGLEVAIARDGRALVVWGDVTGTDVDHLRYPLYASDGRSRPRALTRTGGLVTVAYDALTPVVVFYRGHDSLYRVRGRGRARGIGHGTAFDYRPGPDGRLLELRVRGHRISVTRG